MSFFVRFICRIAGGSTLGIAVLGATTAGALAAATHVVVTSDTRNALSSVGCATSAACVSDTDSTNSVHGVARTSAKVPSVQGSTTGSSVIRSATSRVVMFGRTTNNIGVYGIATHANSRLTRGVVSGSSVNGSTSDGAATAMGTSVDGKGVFGTGDTGVGVDALSSARPTRAASAITSAIHSCLGSMDGAVYHGDPTNKFVMRSYVHDCRFAQTTIRTMNVSRSDLREREMVTERLYDREATLLEMGLDQPRDALRSEIVAAAILTHIRNEPIDQDYRTAVSLQLRLKYIQLVTLRAEIASSTEVAKIAR